MLLRTFCSLALVAGLTSTVSAATVVTVSEDAVQLLGQASNDRVRVDVRHNGLKICSLNSERIIYEGVEAKKHIVPAAPALEVLLGGGNDHIVLRDQRNSNSKEDSTLFPNGVFANMGSGRNSLILNKISLDGDVYYQGGGGRDDVKSINNSFTAGNFTVYSYANGSTVADYLELANVGGDIEVATGAGDDGVIVSGFVGGRMRLFTREGNDSVYIGPSLINNAIIDTGSGSDILTTAGSTILFPTFITLGDGDDLISAVGNYDDPANPIPSTFGDVLYVDAGAGNDDLYFDTVFVASSCKMDLGTGLNSYNIDDTTFDGQCVLRTREDGTTINIEQNEDALGGSQFKGVFIVDFYSGSNVANIGTGGVSSDAYFFQDVIMVGQDPLSTAYVNLPYDPFDMSVILDKWEIVTSSGE